MLHVHLLFLAPPGAGHPAAAVTPVFNIDIDFLVPCADGRRGTLPSHSACVIFFTLRTEMPCTVYHIRTLGKEGFGTPKIYEATIRITKTAQPLYQRAAP